MDKPTGFYISEGLDNRLDQAVQYFQKNHGLKKVDRSLILNALLENNTFWTNESLDQLINKLINLLTHKLISK
jgi:hypothetical protein